MLHPLQCVGVLPCLNNVERPEFRLFEGSELNPYDISISILKL